MPINVERGSFDPEAGRYEYYVALKPNLEKEEADVQLRVPVEVAVSVSENGELADLSFELPKKYRTEHALSFVKAEKAAAQYIDPRVFIAVPGQSGDAVLATAANLEFDAAGRLIGVDIH